MKTETNVKKKSDDGVKTIVLKSAKSAAALAVEESFPTNDAGAGKGLGIVIAESSAENEILKKDDSVFAPLKEKAKKLYDDSRYSDYLSTGYVLAWQKLAKANDSEYFTSELAGYSRKSSRHEHIGCLRRVLGLNTDSHSSQLTRKAKAMEYVDCNLELEFAFDNYDEKAAEVADFIKDNGGIHGCASKLDEEEGTYTSKKTPNKLTAEQVLKFSEDLISGCKPKGSFELTSNFPTPENELVAMIGHKQNDSIDIVVIATNPKAVEMGMNNLDK
jgi:hypothetical protein